VDGALRLVARRSPRLNPSSKRFTCAKRRSSLMSWLRREAAPVSASRAPSSWSSRRAWAVIPPMLDSFQV